MEDLHKLHHVIEHWIEHNEGHVTGYLEWARKADALGRGDLSALLVQIADRTRELTSLLEEARVKAKH